MPGLLVDIQRVVDFPEQLSEAGLRLVFFHGRNHGCEIHRHPLGLDAFFQQLIGDLLLAHHEIQFCESGFAK